jgi:hypothetical protein
VTLCSLGIERQLTMEEIRQLLVTAEAEAKTID